MTNRDLALNVLKELCDVGVKHLVICPGGRSAPLCDLLSSDGHPFTLHSHFDERAAGFYGLGLSQSESAPVAVITTSGTAVSETLSACVEAHYSSTPLIILSADRPKSYRGSGAPQAIRQTELLRAYCSQVYDLESEPLKIQGWDRKSPLHINVCFDEPLIDQETVDLVSVFSQKVDLTPIKASLRPADPKAIQNFFSRSKRPLVIVSGSAGFDHGLVAKTLRETRLPIFFESTSGLKSDSAFEKQEVEFPELSMNAGFVDGIIRIGHVPTHRIWRDLEALKLPVLSFSHHSFSGLSRESQVFSLSALKDAHLQELRHPDVDILIEKDREQRLKRERALSEFPLSEPALIRSLQEFWNSDGLVYLGNSLPIREWDYVSSKGFSKVAASRGANGIDGQISTFIGRSLDESESLGLFGDLTSLYDMSAPWFLKHSKGIRYITVVNNFGGMIFDRMFGKEIYLNKHFLSFESLARFWNIDFKFFKSDENPFDHKTGIIEVKPDLEQTKAFWEAMK